MNSIIKLDSKCSNNFFLMIDMDGTITDTENIHYNGYKYALEQYGINIDYDEYINLSNNGKVDEYLKEKIPDNFKTIKIIKNSHIKTNNIINLMKGAEELINYIICFNINHVVVTNTSKENVDFFKEKNPLLNKLTNWITKEDYKYPKPNNECYFIAKSKYYKNEKYIIGIENTICGYNAIKFLTNIVYIMTSINNSQYSYFKIHDVNIIDDLQLIYKIYNKY